MLTAGQLSEADKVLSKSGWAVLSFLFSAFLRSLDRKLSGEVFNRVRLESLQILRKIQYQSHFSC